ncbi:hypothetical protein HYU92_05060 [Candidatus Curtissbacteria bacterium]|nr:hypothetical protein [Candidatus Curtissbacteria bacterium]
MKKIIFLFFLLLTVIAISALTTLKPKSATPQVKSQQTQDVKELTEILSSNQETRLKGTRKLAERVGVEQALEIVQKSGLPYTGEGHLAVHQIGFYAYKIYGKDAILHCKDYYLYACYHGAIIEAATDQGFPVIKEMTDRCKSLSSRYFQCMHAAGHSIMAIWNYHMPEALKTCDDLFEKNQLIPDTLTSCHNGVFMENLFGVHDWGTGQEIKRDWIGDDPYFPCDYFGQKYQKGCWLNQAARIYQMNKGDLKKTGEVCNAIKNHQNRAWCMDNLARQIHPLTEGHVEKAYSLCEALPSQWYQECVIVNAVSYFSVGDPQTGIRVCNQFPNQGQPACTNRIIPMITSGNFDTVTKRSLCNLLQPEFSGKCQRSI